MCLRSVRERVIQVILYESFALCLTVPLYAVVLDRPPAQALGVVLGLTFVEILWGLLHDWVFDRIELRLTARPADLRPMRRRCLHALSREATLFAVSIPAIMALAGVGFWAALTLDLAVTIIFVGYSLAFFRLYDWFRPIPTVRDLRAS